MGKICYRHQPKVFNFCENNFEALKTLVLQEYQRTVINSKAIMQI